MGGQSQVRLKNFQQYREFSLLHSVNKYQQSNLKVILGNVKTTSLPMERQTEPRTKVYFKCKVCNISIKTSDDLMKIFKRIVL